MNYVGKTFSNRLCCVYSDSFFLSFDCWGIHFEDAPIWRQLSPINTVPASRLKNQVPHHFKFPLVRFKFTNKEWGCKTLGLHLQPHKSKTPELWSPSYCIYWKQLASRRGKRQNMPSKTRLCIFNCRNTCLWWKTDNPSPPPPLSSSIQKPQASRVRLSPQASRSLFL